MSEGVTPPRDPTDIDPSATVLDEKAAEALQLLDRHYAILREGEARQPLPEDQRRLYVDPEHPEYQALREVVPEEQLEAGGLTREQMQAAGFSFVNVVGNGEKGIMSGKVVDPDSGQEHDFTGRVLLTRGELDVIYRYQQSQPEIYGLQGQDVHEVRKDMLSFVQEAVSEPPFRSGRDFASQALDYNLSNGLVPPVTGTDQDWATVKRYWDHGVKAYRRDHPDGSLDDYEVRRMLQREFARRYCTDIYEWGEEEGGAIDSFNTKQVRGHATQTSNVVRRHKIDGQLSPFLDSGFVFGANLDCNVYMGDEVDQRSNNQLRINMATIHLAGGHPDFPGLSEMGGAGDQQYMPTGVYVETFYARDATERQRLQGSEQAFLARGSRGRLIAAGQQRLIEVAKEQAPPPTPMERVQRIIRKRAY